jgi:tetratricopeptide (TPR) repeat protein
MPPRKPARKQQPQPRKAADPGSASRSAGRPARKLGDGLAYSLIIAATLVAFANAWPNNLVFDDRVFADYTRFSGLGPGDLWRFFTEDLWAGSGESSSLYRPLLLLLVAGESALFKGWMAGYHLVNIGLHVLATVLVFGFVRRLLQRCGHVREEAIRLALLAALVFGVHPIHTEVVNSVFNGSEILVTIGVMGGLSWFLDRLEARPVQAWFGLNLAFLLVLLCRESGAAMPLLVVATLWLTRSDPWLQRLRACAPVLSMLVPLAIYLALRSQALGGAAAAPGGPAAPPVLAEYGLDFGLGKVAPAIVLWFESLKHLAWPHPLQIYYDPSQTPVWLALALQLVILAGALFAWWRKQPLFPVGLVFFYAAILPSSRIISEPGLHALVSDRILYLPSVGFVIMLAFGLHRLAQKLGPGAATVATLAIMMAMVPLTWARNADWADDVTLFETDYRKLSSKQPILNTLLAAHLRENNPRRAAEICDENRQLTRAGHSSGAHCGAAYGLLGRFGDAEQAYLAVKTPLVRGFANFNLGLMYLHLGREAEAKERIELAIAAEPMPFMKLYFRAVALMQMYPRNRDRLREAQALLQQALELQPQHVESRMELEQLNRKLDGQ